jgi:hypothetical protein
MTQHMNDLQERTGESEPREDEVTKGLERYTAAIPPSAFLAAAVGAIGVSLLAQLGGRGKWGNFVAQWAPTLLLMGVYNKLVKVGGHDQADGGARRDGARHRQPSGISNRSLGEERESQASLPSRGHAAPVG